MAKLTLELGGKYTAGQVFSKAQSDLKAFGKETKDIGQIGTKVFDTISSKIDGPLKDSMSAASGMIKGLASGGLWGIVSAAAGAAIGYIVTKWNEAKEAAKKFGEYMSGQMVDKIKGVNKEFEGTKNAIKDAQKAAEDALGVLNGNAAAYISNRVYEIHTEAMQKVTDGMTEKGKAVIAAQEKLDVALLKQEEMTRLNAKALEQLENNVQDANKVLNEAKDAESQAWQSYAKVTTMNADILGKQGMLQARLDKIQEEYEAGLIKKREYEKRSAEVIQEKTELEKEYSSQLQAVKNAMEEHKRAEANVQNAMAERASAENALARAKAKNVESENALKTAVDDANKARRDANAALEEETKATKEAAEKKRQEIAKKEEQAELDAIKENLAGEDIQITKLCLDYKYDEAQYIRMYNQLRLAGIDEEEAYQTVMAKLNERKDAEAKITEVCQKYKVDEATYIKRYNELTQKGIEETDTYAELQKQLNEELKKRAEAEAKANEEAKKGQQKNTNHAAMTVNLSNSASDDIGEKVEKNQGFKNEQKRNRDELRKARDQKNNMKIDQAKMTRALKGEMPKAEAEEWIKYAKRRYTPDQMRELANLAVKGQLMSPKSKEWREQDRRFQNMLKQMQDDGKEKKKADENIKKTAENTKNMYTELKKQVMK